MDRTRKESTGGHGGWWIRQQGGDVRVIHQAERPDSTAREGERRVNITGPFQSEELAKKRAEKMQSRAISTRGATERGR